MHRAPAHPSASTRQPRRRILAAVIAVAALLGASFVAMSTADAVAQQATTLTGSTTLASQPPIPFPAGSGWSGTSTTPPGRSPMG